MLLSALPTLLQLEGVLATPLGKLFASLVAVAAVILVLRLALRVAWRLVTIAAVLVAIAALVMFFLP